MVLKTAFRLESAPAFSRMAGPMPDYSLCRIFGLPNIFGLDASSGFHITSCRIIASIWFLQWRWYHKGICHLNPPRSACRHTGEIPGIQIPADFLRNIRCPHPREFYFPPRQCVSSPISEASFLNVFRGINASSAGLHHHHKFVHGLGRGSSQMLDAGFHIHDHHLVSGKHNVGDQCL